MNKEKLEKLIKRGALRMREIDKVRIRAMIASAVRNVTAVLSIPLNEESATVVFREIYESLRQLGDARLWLLGYEPREHDVSLEALMELNLKDNTKLNYLERFKKIRHDANYRGFVVSLLQAREIIELWKVCSPEIVKLLLREL